MNHACENAERLVSFNEFILSNWSFQSCHFHSSVYNLSFISSQLLVSYGFVPNIRYLFWDNFLYFCSQFSSSLTITFINWITWMNFSRSQHNFLLEFFMHVEVIILLESALEETFDCLDLTFYSHYFPINVVVLYLDWIPVYAK